MTRRGSAADVPFMRSMLPHAYGWRVNALETDIPLARYLSPSLSSVHVPIAELGTRAMERLLHAVENKNEHERRRETVATTLVVRGSCGGAPEPRPDELEELLLKSEALLQGGASE